MGDWFFKRDSMSKTEQQVADKQELHVMSQRVVEQERRLRVLEHLNIEKEIVLGHNDNHVDRI